MMQRIQSLLYRAGRKSPVRLHRSILITMLSVITVTVCVSSAFSRKDSAVYLSSMIPAVVGRGLFFMNKHSGNAEGKRYAINLGGKSYEQGICLHPDHYVLFAIEYTLGGKYRRFESVYGINSAKQPGESEWGAVNPRTHEFIKWLGGTFKGHERREVEFDVIRISGGASLTFYGDGKELASTGVFRPGEAKKIAFPVQGVQVLKIVVSNDHEELAEAPYRDKEPQGGVTFPYLVKGCCWYNEVNLAEPRLFR